ncbi:MAG: acyl-CoA thioesterase [Deltaproteobacteria bacterium]|jgi:acyl-CoA thioester hydrolase|nr:acyl-CoA thioesterase [Deltaproteobacteria bacterium]
MAMKSYEKQFTVPFYDLDPMQVVWHGNYLKYFDTTREELCHAMGFDPVVYYRDTNILFPIIKTSTKHIVSLRYRDRFTCKATVKEAHYKIVVDFEIRLDGDGTLCSKGRSEQVAVKYPETEILFEIPGDIRKTLGF